RCKIDTAGGESFTFISIPFDVKKVFGKARLPVKLTINDFTYRTTISVMGGKYCVPLRKSNRESAGVKAGDVVQISVVPDIEPRGYKSPRNQKKIPETKKVWETIQKFPQPPKKRIGGGNGGGKKKGTPRVPKGAAGADDKKEGAHVPWVPR